MAPTEIGVNAAYVKSRGDGVFRAAAEYAATHDTTDRGEPKWSAAAEATWLNATPNAALIRVDEDDRSETYAVRLTGTALTFGGDV